MKRATLLLATLTACGAADEDLGAALPRAERLQIGLPASGALGKPGEPAELWLLTRRTADDLNGMVLSVVGQVGAILDHAPSRVADGQAVWGPITPALSPVTYRLVAARGPTGVEYHLDAKPKAADDTSYQIVLAGAAAPDGHAGQIHVDLARLRALDPGAPADGAALTVGYDLEPATATLALELDGAHYGYAQRASGAGDLAFSGPDGAIRSRWRSSGAGRAELAGGGVQCWDDGFRLVFAAGPGGADGDPAACADVE